MAISFFGEVGNDSATMPVGAASFIGGIGSNSVLYTVINGDNPNVTLTNNRISNDLGSASYSDVSSMSVVASTAASVTVQSTNADSTNVTLGGGGGRVSVFSTSGPLNVVINNGDPGNQAAAVSLASTGAPVTITGSSAGQSTVNIGTGLLSRIGSQVTVQNVSFVVYDNSGDGTSRTPTLTGAGVSIPNVFSDTGLTGVKSVELRMGAGDDIINATLGNTALVVSGGGGNDTVNATLNGSLSARTPLNPALAGLTAASNVERVNFVHAGNTDSSNWSLDNGLVKGAKRTGTNPIPSSSDLTILNVATSALNINLSDGDDLVEIKSVVTETNVSTGGGFGDVSVGGGDIGNIQAALNVTSTSTGNSLTYRDELSQKLASRVVSFSNGRFLVLPASGSITFDQSKFSNLEFRLGESADTLELGDLPSGVNSVHAGAGNDKIISHGLVGTLTIHGDADDDNFVMQSGTGTVTLSGDDGRDMLTIDRSDAVTNLSGSLTVSNGKPIISLDGPPTINMDDAIEELSILLGAGSDQFFVNSAGYNPLAARIEGGAGDDVVAFASAGGNSNDRLFTVIGGDGQDTVKLLIANNPATSQFASVVPKVERLNVDHSASSSNVSWQLNGTTMKANGVSIVDTTGATAVNLIGGSSDRDSFTVSGSDPNNPVDVTLNGNRINVQEGLSVLSQSTPTISPASVTTSVTGLAEARAVVTSTDGKMMFVAGGAAQPGIAIFRRDPATNAFLYIRTTAITTNGGPDALLLSPDGQWLFARATDSSGLSLYRVDASSAEIAFKRSYS